MKSTHTLMTLAALFTLGACSAEPAGSVATEPSATGLTQEELSIIDCQRQVATCTRAARSFQDFGKCTVDLQSCTSQAALDLVGQGNLLSNCRSKADACLKGAVTMSDITACRDIYSACSSDVTTTAGDALSGALKTAGDAISKVGDIATDLIGKAGGDVSKALGALDVCENKASACLKAAVKATDVTPCQEVFDTCADQAISIVSTVVDPLPGPTPGQLVNGLSQCQTQSTACLKGALTVSDVSSCRSVLDTCVKNASSLIDSTITDVTSILPLPVKVPGVGQTVDCTTSLTDCLLKLGNPIDCAAQAQACVTK
jgi:hypothetical protein